MSELVVFTERENFDFLKFGSRVTEAQKYAFKVDCQRAQNKQRTAARCFGVWAMELCLLKNGGVWESVINPETGFAFFNDGFGEFCKHAFGMPPSTASDLVRVAQFVQESGPNSGLLKEEYSDYNYSKLVELAAVPPEYRVYFSAEMTREEMRVAKAYIKSSGEFLFEKKKVGFDLLTQAQAWKDSQKKTSEPRLDVIPGQIELENITDSATVEPNRHADLANDGERVLTEEEREEVIKNILLFEPWRDKRKRLYDKYKGNCSMYEFLLEVKTEYLFKGCSTNDGWGMEANSKGFVISALFDEEYEFFVAWEQIAARIVKLINRGEYYTEDDERIEQAREAAHKAGIPFYEGDAEEFDPYVYDGKMSVEDYKLMHEQMDADKATDECDELDEAQADMQADMRTIEEESERSLPPVEESPIKKYDFSTRDNIRFFLNDYENWYYRDDIRTPFTKYCYWITLPNYDILYAFEMNVATGATLEGKQEHATEVEYFIFLQSQYYYKEMPDVFKITKRDLEGYLMVHRDELKRR